MKQTLAGRRAIVTGASSGIGAALSRAIVHAGGSVGMIARRADRLSALASELGERALALPCDVADTESMQKVVDDAARRFGGLDTVISNAGNGFLGRHTTQGDPAKWRRFMEVNLIAAFAVVQAALRHFPEQGARDVIFMGSTAARTPDPLIGVYSAAKRGLAAFADSLRLELGTRKIRVCLIEPTGIATEVYDHIEVEGDAKFDMDQVMAGVGYTLISSEEMAEVIMFLLTRPDHLGINNVVVRPTGELYP